METFLIPVRGETVRSLINCLDGLRVDVLSIQYPTRAYGASLTPLLLALRAPCPVCLTLHEYSQANFLRRAALNALINVARVTIVFTSASEQARCRRLRASGVQNALIPVPSNIPIASYPAARDERTVVYFGLLRPKRGLEEFLELARRSRSGAHANRFQLVGSIPEDAKIYADKWTKVARDLGVEVFINLPRHDLAECLARCGYAYLPFPTGADERRGSLIAALSNGVCVITTRGAASDPELESALCYVSSPEGALAALDTLRENIPRRDALQRAGRRFVAKRSWTSVTDAYISCFNDVQPP